LVCSCSEDRPSTADQRGFSIYAPVDDYGLYALCPSLACPSLDVPPASVRSAPRSSETRSACTVQRLTVEQREELIEDLIALKDAVAEEKVGSSPEEDFV